MNLCKNGHPVYNGDGKIFLLSGCVIHCHNCGKTITLDQVSVFYLGDRIDSQGIWHIYYFYPTFSCKSCGTSFTTYAVICQPMEESILNYEMYKKANVSSKVEGQIL
jgi:ribosomal protein L31